MFSPNLNLGPHQVEPTFWFMKNWAVRTASSNEAGDDACSRPATSRVTQAREVSTEKPKTVPQQGGVLTHFQTSTGKHNQEKSKPDPPGWG